VEWFKVKALGSNSSTKKKIKKTTGALVNA
jgi:hypothetical protein